MAREEIERLGRLLCASIAANRYREAEQLIARCAKLHTIETHVSVIAVLDRARELALVEKSILSQRRAQAHQAEQYSGFRRVERFVARG